MSDEEENEDVTRLEQELDSWKAKYKALELKKRESDLSLNKIKTEINSLRSMDKLWKDACKTIYQTMTDTKKVFDLQVTQIVDAIAEVAKADDRVAHRMLQLKRVQKVIFTLQRRINKQDETINTLNASIRSLTVELAEKTAKVERLSLGIEEEVERLIKPMRDKLSEAMTQVMREKAARAQERREIADLWPKEHILPTLLMRYRALTDDERERRVQIAQRTDASRALSIEIRANVAESKMWEVKYDDYGRQYYQHSFTGESCEEMPEIVSYKPPPGRDESGNVIVDEDNDANNWLLFTDNRGQVYYRHKLSNVVTYVPPFAYQRIPAGKSREQLVSESAAIVLEFVKEKIEKHIAIKAKRKAELENPLSFDEQKKKEKADRNRSAEEIAAAGPELTEEDEVIDLSLFNYDIETVEMLAGRLTDEDKKNTDKDPDEVRAARTPFLHQLEVRNFDEQLWMGKMLKQWSTDELTVDKLRSIVEELALGEEKLEKQLSRTRSHIKDYSYLLQEKISLEDKLKFEKYKQLRLDELRLAKVEKRRLRIERAEKIKEAQAAREAARARELEAAAETAVNASVMDENTESEAAMEAPPVPTTEDSIEKVGDAEGDHHSQSVVEDSIDDESSVAKEDESLDYEDEASLQSSVLEKSVGSGNPNALLPFDDEELAAADKEVVVNEKRDAKTIVEQTPNGDDNDNEDQIDTALNKIPDSFFQKELEGDPVMKLFGDLELQDLQTDFSVAMTKLCRELSNFSLFCGFNNLNATKLQFDGNHNFAIHNSLQSSSDALAPEAGQTSATETRGSGECKGNDAGAPIDEDEQWLTAHFFVNCSREELSAFNEVLKRQYDDTAGMLPIGPLNAETVVFETTPSLVQRSLDHAYLPLSRLSHENPMFEQYVQWKNHHLLSEVVRNQLQQQAIQEVMEQRLRAFDKNSPVIRNSQSHLHTDIVSEVVFTNLTFNFAEPLTQVQLSNHWVELSIGSWRSRTQTVFPSQHGFVLPRVNITAFIPVNDMHLHDLQVELHKDNADARDSAVVARGYTHLHDVVGCNFGRHLPLQVSLSTLQKRKTIVGVLQVDVRAEVYHKEVQHLTDPFEKMRLEVLQTSGRTERMSLEFNSRERSMNFITAEEFASVLESKRFRQLVNDLRGDFSTPDNKPVTIAQFLTGDYALKSIHSAFKEVTIPAAKKLPNFKDIEIFLQKKMTIHLASLSNVKSLLAQRSKELLDSFKVRTDQTGKQLADAKRKFEKFFGQSESMKEDIIRSAKAIIELRKPLPPPKEPEFPPLEDPPYVPELPTAAGLDARGKKKKALTSADLKALLDAIENGDHDGKEELPLPENLFPSQAQALKIGKVIIERNAVHDAKRAQELNTRDQIMQFYENEKLKWEAMERKRLLDLEKAKKDSRKINLKYDCLMERVNRLQSEMNGCEVDMKTIANLRNMHEKCSESHKLFRIRLGMEKERQIKHLHGLRLRLLRAINARRYALTFPSTAANGRQFEEFRQQSEEALRYLRLEIVECRTLLEKEGIRLRHQWQEEVAAYENERTRINVSLEVLKQKEGYDQLLSKYKVEIMHLFVDIEKHKLLEADKDDVGLETVDDLGERFVSHKNWTSPNVIKCQRMIEMLTAKVDVTEGLGRSTGESQRLIVDAINRQSVATDYFFVADSWIVASDYERAQQLTRDTIRHLTSSRTLLQQLLNNQHQLPLMQFQLASELREAQMQQHHELHEMETKNVRQTAEIILEGARRHLASYRDETNAKLTHLEQSIVDLSRECQKVREELLHQQMVYDDKLKVLWAFIYTLQTALQQLSAKMEIAMEERERVVIESRLMADNTRHQLRIERQHCANLSFIIHSQKGVIQYLKKLVKKVHRDGQQQALAQKSEKNAIKKELWETVYTFSRLCTDIDLLFEFFATRIANLSGSRAKLNDQLADHNAALVLAALCRSPKPIVRRAAARALGNMGWNGFVEKRILLWDCIMYWKMIKTKVLSSEKDDFASSLKKFNETGQYDAALTMTSEVEEFVPNGNLSLRSIIKQRRQWALRAARRIEGPNIANQRLLNVRDGVLVALLQLCVDSNNSKPVSGDTDVESTPTLSSDWEIARNAALAISIASYEPTNHKEMVQSSLVVRMLLQMCALQDAEIQTHAAVTIANLCFRDEEAQRIFGRLSMDNGPRGGRGANGVIAQLLRMLEGPVADVLEASTAALANLTSYCDENCETVFLCDGLPKIIKVITQSYSENLLDLDQNDEVHANASEVLANISRFSTKASTAYFTADVIDALVVMCASKNKQLRRHVSLVMGNIAQNETCREEVGSKGGIESLFLAVEDTDNVVKANALWALSNLMWHPPNQERAGRFMSDIVNYLQTDIEPVLINASNLLGNVLYYSTPNRVRFLDIDGSFELLIEFVRSYHNASMASSSAMIRLPPVSVLEACLRSLLSLSYLDSISMWLGEEGNCIPTLLFYLKSPQISKDVLRSSLEIICNLCLHHANRRIIYEQDGISAIVPLHSDTDSYIRELSVQIIEHLEDITPAEVLARARQLVGLERMVTLATNDDPLVRAVAAEAIGEEVWRNPDKQSRAHEIGAIDSLLAIVHNPEESLQSLLPAIWSLRNLIHDHAAAQAQFGFRDGIKLVCAVIRRGLSGSFAEQSEKVFESCVACLIAAVTKEPRNSRRLAMIGLDALVEISEESSLLKRPKSSLSPAFEHVLTGIRSESVQALVNHLLLSLAPYNYVVCKNCGHKQDLHGTSCYFCGHRLLVDVDPDVLAQHGVTAGSPTKGTMRQSQSASSIFVPPWRHAGRATDTALAAVQESKSSNNLQQSLRPLSATRNRSVSQGKPSIQSGAVGNLDNKKPLFSKTLPSK